MEGLAWIDHCVWLSRQHLHHAAAELHLVNICRRGALVDIVTVQAYRLRGLVSACGWQTFVALTVCTDIKAETLILPVPLCAGRLARRSSQTHSPAAYPFRSPSAPSTLSMCHRCRSPRPRQPRIRSHPRHRSPRPRRLLVLLCCRALECTPGCSPPIR